MPRVWVSIGSNVDRERHVLTAVADLTEKFGPLILSRVYESDSVGFVGESFYNLVAGFETDLDPVELNGCCRAIEDAHGRARTGDKFSPRTLDLDLLTYGEQVIERPGLRLPRDEILEYAFVLGPLAEVAGSERHPVLARSYRELWQDFDRESQPLRPVRLDLGIESPITARKSRSQC